MYQPIDYRSLKVGAYRRKSQDRDDRQALSLTSQADEARQSGANLGFKVFREYEEKKSAKSPHLRPEFDRLITDIEAGEIDSIVCWKPDRLARNMVEGGIIIHYLLTGKIKCIITSEKVWESHESSIYLSFKFAEATDFSITLSKNVKTGQRTKARTTGTPHGVAPIGYLNGGGRYTRWKTDDERVDLVQALLKRFLTGLYSAASLHEYAVKQLKLTTVKRKKSGGHFIARSKIYDLLSNPIYAGFFFEQEQRYEFDKDLPRLITEAEHYKILTILGNRHNPRVHKHEYAYSGFMTSLTGELLRGDQKEQLVCDCKHKFAHTNRTDCPMCGVKIDEMKHPKFVSYAYYYNLARKRAKLGYKSVRGEKVDELLSEYFGTNLRLSAPLVDWSKKYIHEMEDREIQSELIVQKRNADMTEIRDQAKARVRKLLALEQITKAEYDQDIAQIEKDYIQSTVGSAHKINWAEKMREIVNIGAELNTEFTTMDIERKKTILKALGANLTWDEKILNVTVKKSVQTLIEGVSRYFSDSEKFSQNNSEDTSHQNNKKDPNGSDLSSLCAE